MVNWSSRETTIRPSWLKSGTWEPLVKLSTGRPRTESQSRSRDSQPLLASSVPVGWKAARKPRLVEPSRVAFRVPVAASQR